MSAETSPVETCSPSTSPLAFAGAPYRLYSGRGPNHLHNLAERPACSSKRNMAASIAILTPQSIHSPTSFSRTDTEPTAPLPPSISLPSVAAAAAAAASAASASIAASAATAAATTAPSPPQRPKLSLNTAATSHPRSFGRGNTGLRLDTLSGIASPTARNTYRNTYDHGLGQSSRAGASPNPASALSSAAATSASLSSSSSASSSSLSSAEDIDSSRVPYSIPHTIHSILRNSPIQKPHQIMTSTPTSSTTRIRLFPPTRRVTFAPAHTLCQEISTSVYTARHQDLLDEELAGDDEQEATGFSSWSRTPARRSEKSPRSKEVHIDPQLLAPEKFDNETARVGDKRESSSPESPSEMSSGSSSSSSGDEDENTCPKTPVAGRAKRRREWVWTLGPIGGANVEP